MSKPWPKRKKFLVVGLCLLAALFTLPYAVPSVGDYLNTMVNQWKLERIYHQTEQSSSQAPSSQPAQGGEPVMLEKFADLYSTNSDLVGWIDIAGGGLSQPVLQTDDNEYYLKHDFYKEENKNGSIYMDWRNHVYPLDYDTVIYGHNTRLGMFTILENYRKLEYLEKHPTIDFDTLYEEGEYVIFSVFLAATREEHGENFNYINRMGLKTDEEKAAYIQELRDHSLFNADIDVQPGDQLLTLSTCVYDFSDARLGIVARKLRPGESAADFAGSYSVNPSPVMPEVWEALYGD